ncbi:TetR/AcrR family transcriptional regulator [Alkalibacter saccharofermentans]|uniref:Transcriptional regulator, TetR family n=1 Tax=Alkalibacter saccharofermentans DSM 14828 TaxID=1120975 RepID=A0A1M4T3H3_9FIRM|nr:TetR/AcrR family transcriptional regulator [Alkalibacter saccharofermentans]SHE38847.1 transcriptional regulator, TetR family [Alkalibacter saccharofermentans DSM 14828]
MKKISAADKIYQAAKSLFYESGYYGTTTRDITTKSSTNLGLIKYYFDSKKVLAYKMISEIFDELLGSLNKYIKADEDPLFYAMVYTHVFMSMLFSDEKVESFIVESFSDEIMEEIEDAFYRSYQYDLNLKILETHAFSPEYNTHQTIQLNLFSFHNAIKSIGRMRQRGRMDINNDQFRLYIFKLILFGLGINLDDEQERMKGSFDLSNKIINDNDRLKIPSKIFLDA